jgi:hypothetical protein
VISSSRQGTVDLYRKEIGGGDEVLVFHSIEDKYAAEWLGDASVVFKNVTGKTFYRVRLSGDLDSGERPTTRAYDRRPVEASP